jgi:hypothetical protein
MPSTIRLAPSPPTDFLSTQRTTSYKAVMLHLAQGSREMTPSSDRETPSDITAHGTQEGAKGGRKRRKQCLQGTTTTTNDNDSMAGGSDMRCLSTTTGSDKHQARPPTDHFKWLLEEACPNHIYPIRHKLKDCGMMRIFMTSGSLTWGEELDEGPDRSDTTPFPEEKVIMSASIQNSSSSAVVDKDVIREDGSSALPNTKS